MNLEFKLGRLSRRTLMALIRAIGPVELEIPHLEESVVDHIELQLRQFPTLHRRALLFGIAFLEWGGPLGGWGLRPLSTLSRDAATRRLILLSQSRWAPLRHLVTGLKVLICLSAYGHPGVERKLGFERRKWRDQRVRVRQALLRRDQIESIGGHDALNPLHLSDLPPTPEALHSPLQQQQIDLLSWDIDPLELQAQPPQALSPFSIEDWVSPRPESRPESCLESSEVSS